MSSGDWAVLILALAIIAFVGLRIWRKSREVQDIEEQVLVPERDKDRWWKRLTEPRRWL